MAKRSNEIKVREFDAQGMFIKEFVLPKVSKNATLRETMAWMKENGFVSYSDLPGFKKSKLCRCWTRELENGNWQNAYIL